MSKPRPPSADAAPGRLGALKTRLARGARLAAAPALAALLALTAARAWDPAPFELARHMAWDAFQRAAPRPPSPPQTLIVDVDEASIRALGQWPWSRGLLARLVDRLADAEVASIGFDMVFAEPDRLSPPAFASGAENLPPMVRGLLSGLPSTDDAFAAAIARAPVVLGISGSVETPTAPAGDAAPAASAGAGSALVEIGGDPRPHLFGFPTALRNLPALEAAGAGVGLFSLAPERDGVVRRVPGALRIGGRVAPTLALEMLRVAAGAGSIGVVTRADGAGISGFGVADRFVPSDRHGRFWQRFAPHDRSLYVSAKDLLAGATPPERLRGKHVLIGASAVGLRDLRMTPIDASIPGVEIHAQLIDAILTGHALSRPPELLGLEHLIALAIGGGLILVLPRLGAATGPPIALGAVGAVWAAAFVAFDQRGLALDPTYPSAAALIVYAAVAYGAYARAEAQKRRIRSAFRQYLAPAMVERLAEDPDSLRLGGESREMTFLFSDIAGFTAFVERSGPEALVRHLNEYLDGVCGIVMRHRGAIDKIVGDAVHAMFNAPLDDPEHAANAVRAALEIDAFVTAFRARKAAEGVDFGGSRIGVNTGRAIVGNFGGANRFDYTAHGDAINTAARLESVNKHLGTTICVSGRTVALCPDLAFRPIGTLYLKGKAEGVEAFEPVRPEAAADPTLETYCALMARLRAADAVEPERARRDGREIASSFAALAADRPDDPLFALHARRLRAGELGAAIRMSDK